MKKRLFRALLFLAFFYIAAFPAFSLDTGIEIQSTLPGVKVFVDGVQKGITSAVPFGSNSILRVPAAPGTYSLQFEYSNYSFQPDIQVTVPRDGFAIHIVTANPPRIVSEPLSVTGSTAVLKTGTIIVRSNPALANVDLDGKKLEHLTDVKISGVEAGKRRISVYSRTTRPLTVDFDLKAETTMIISADFSSRTILAKATYQIEVNSAPQGIYLTVDGVDMGRTPATLFLEPGSRTLGFSGEGFAEVKRGILVQAPARLSETMAAAPVTPAAVPPVAPVAGPPVNPVAVPPVNPVAVPPVNPVAVSPSPAPAILRYLERYTALYGAADPEYTFDDDQRRRAQAAESDTDQILAENRIAAGYPAAGYPAAGPKLEVPEYLRRIDTLEAAKKSMELRFDLAKAEGLRQAATLFDAKIKALRDANPIEDWENAADLERRLAPLLAPVEKAKAEDLARYTALLDAEKNLRVGTLSASHEDAKTKFAAASYFVQGPAVSFEAGSYDRDRKLWPIKVISSEKDFAYVANFDYSILNEKDIGAAYKEFTAALGAGTLAARLEYSYARMPGSENLSVSVKRAALFDVKNSKVYASGGESKPVFGVRADDLSTRLPMPRLVLESVIPGTVVKMGEKVLGVCPMEFAIEEGRHTLTFIWDKAPYGGKDIEVTVKFGEKKNIRAGDDVAYLRLEKIPQDGDIYIDGAKVPNPKDILALEAGEKEVLVKSPNFIPWKSTAKVTPGAVENLVYAGVPTLVPMVAVAGGSFSMSSPEADSRPVRQVKVSSFLLGKTEVTQGQYKEVMGANPSVFGAESDAAGRPVENVTWFDAVNFCNALSEKEGFEKVYSIDGAKVTADFSKSGYRLPTEAEWEYAARGGQKGQGGKGTAFAGAEDASKVAWYEATSGGGTKPAAILSPNEIGAHDMSGNVWEWCWDWYGPFDSQPQTDPAGPDSGEAKAIRGGGWYNASAFSRIALGSAAKPDTKDLGIGFRVVRKR